MNRNSFINTFASLLVSISVLVGVAIPMKSLAETQPAAGAAAEVSTISGPQTDLNNVIKNYTSSELNRDLGLLIPILSVMIIFGGPVLIVILLVTQHYKAQKRLMELRRECIGKLIDAGKDVPESLLFFDDLARDKNPERDLSRGIKNVGLGLGIAIFLTAVNSLQAGTFGLILVALGGAQLLSWKLTRTTA